MNKNDKKKNFRKTKPLTFKEFKVKETIGLLDFLYSKYPNLSRNNVKHLLTNRHVSIDGAIVTQFDTKLSKEDVVIVFDEPIRRTKAAPKLPVLYEDNDFLVIDKPSGLLSIQSDKEKRKTAFRMATEYVQSKDKKSRLYVVHRLDEDTSGVLVFAKNEELKNALQKNWQDIVMKRGYYAVVEGVMKEKSATYVDYLKENSLNLMYVTNDRKNGKKSITSYEVIRENDKYSLLDVSIDSGRKNQIRVQLGHRGHYVLGDDKYGEPENPLNRLALHAYELILINPLTKKQMKFRSKMPKEFLTLF